MLTCVAQRDEGIAQLLQALERHRRWLTTTPAGEARRVERSRREILALLRDRWSAALLERQSAQIEELAQRVGRGEIDPYVAVQTLLDSAGLV